MKRSYLLIFILLFSISLISAAEFDNVGRYNEDTRTMKIDNWFGMGGNLAEITLNTPQNNIVPAGYQKVAEFTVNNKGNYNEALRTMQFYNVNDNLNEFSRDFDYKVRSYVNVNVDDYGIVCSRSGNNTNVCTSQKVGSHTEQRERWTKLNNRDLSTGEYTIAIFTMVEPNERVEWIPTFYGVRINEWAVWTSALEVDLISYWKYDETSGTTAFDSFSDNNGTLFPGVIVDVPGILLTAFEFNGTGFIDVEGLNSTTGDYTYQFWLNATDLAGFQIIYDDDGGDAGDRIFMYTTINDNESGAFINGAPISFNVSIPVGVFTHVVYIFDSVAGNVSLYIDGVGQGNATYSSETSGGNSTFGSSQLLNLNDYRGVMDEVAMWERAITGAEVLFLYQNGSALPFDQNVTLNAPADNFLTNLNPVTFNCSSEFSSNIENMSLYTNQSGSFVLGNITSGIASLNHTQTWDRTFTSGSYLWNCEACLQTGECSFSDSNFTLTVDLEGPFVNITSPLISIALIEPTQTFQLNWTINDTFLDDCWYDYNGTNTTVTCASNTTDVIYEASNNDIILYANDTTGTVTSDSSTWVILVSPNSQTFNANTTEGSTEAFSLNYTGNETPVSANFIYNGSITSADIDATNFPIVIVSESIVIPNVDALTVLPFFWNIVTLNSDVNTSSTNQTVSNLALDSCGSFSNVLFNFTVVDEATQVILNGSGDNVSVEVDISLFTSDKSTLVLNFSTAFNDTNPVAICSEQDLFNGSNYILDGTIKYSAGERAIEYHNIRDSTIDNATTTQNITLFDIKTSESTEFQITFKNSNFIVVEGALIQVNRQYVSEGVFKTVELPITDSNGQTVVHLVQNDIVYNYIVTKNNVILGTFNNLVAFCDDASIGQCFISLNALEGTTEVFSPDAGSGISFTALVFNTTSRDLKITFSTNDGTVKSVVMSAIKMDQIGNQTVCSTTVVSSSGTITCNVPDSFGNETIIVTIKVNGATSFTSYFSAENTLDIGIDGLFILLFMVISLAIMFAESKSMTIIGVILGMVGGSLLFLTKGGLLAAGSSFIWLIIMGMILLWKLNSEGQT